MHQTAGIGLGATDTQRGMVNQEHAVGTIGAGLPGDVLHTLSQYAGGETDGRRLCPICSRSATSEGINELPSLAQHLPGDRTCLTLELLDPHPHALVGIQLGSPSALDLWQAERIHGANVEASTTGGAELIHRSPPIGTIGVLIIEAQRAEGAHLDTGTTADAFLTVDL